MNITGLSLSISKYDSPWADLVKVVRGSNGVTSLSTSRLSAVSSVLPCSTHAVISSLFRISLPWSVSMSQAFCYANKIHIRRSLVRNRG